MQKPRVHLSVTAETEEGLKEIAAKKGFSVSEMGSRLLEKAVQAEMKKPEWRGKSSGD